MREKSDQTDDPQFTGDAVLRALSSPRRRHLLARLTDSDGGESLTRLSAEIASRERGTPEMPVTDKSVNRVLVSLHHHHVPMLVDAGIVAWTDQEHRITLTQAARDDWILSSFARENRSKSGSDQSGASAKGD